MYIPTNFKQEEEEKINSFIRENSFGILFSTSNPPMATHLPFLLRTSSTDKSLISHMARANPQWQELQDKEVLIIFHGPHAYISPAWYEEEQVVPTWNYLAVHVYGKVSINDEEQTIIETLDEMTNFYERIYGNNSSPWKLPLEDKYVQQLMKGLVAFEIRVDRMEAKWKLNQNHTKERQIKVMEQLYQQKTEHSVKIAKYMEENIKELIKQKENN